MARPTIAETTSHLENERFIIVQVSEPVYFPAPGTPMLILLYGGASLLFNGFRGD
jgi:hypothetical protein